MQATLIQGYPGLPVSGQVCGYRHGTVCMFVSLLPVNVNAIKPALLSVAYG